MQTGFVFSVGLPAVLCIIMFGLGLSLRLEDFIRILSNPKPVLIGLACHIVILPVICFAMVYLAALPPAIAVGMMLLAASPGGTSSTLFTHLAHGDAALSITLTAVTSVLALISLPIITNISLVLLYGDAEVVYLAMGEVLQIFTIAIVPAMLGVFVHSRYPEAARRLDRPVRILATLFLTVVIFGALLNNRGLVVTWGPTVGATVLAFNLLSFMVGYCLPRIFGVERRQAIAIAMAVGIHNAALVITLALSEYMLDNSEMAIPPAAYGLIAYITGGLFVWVLNRRGTPPVPSSAQTSSLTDAKGQARCQ